MTVAPVPVMVLVLMLPMLVSEVSLVPLVLVGSIGTVLAFVPVVIIVVPRVVNTDLLMSIVGRRGGCGGSACRKGCRQDKCYQVRSSHIILQTAIPGISLLKSR